MLAYFPTPYPGEWWYSVLCRYHVRSGNWQSQTTTKELFQGRVAAPIGALLPNSSIKQVADQLSDFFETRAIIEQHTLFPYQMRFHSLGEKQVVLKRLERGERVSFNRTACTSDKWSPRYCPLCVQEDRERYGEAYWHLVHQISLVKACPIHSCGLIPAAIDPQQMSYTYFPLEAYPVETEFQKSDSATDIELALILENYLTLPMTYGAAEGYSNLAIALTNKGYGKIQQSGQYAIVDGRRVYHDMLETYGNRMLQVFGNDRAVCMINRMGKWEITVPERYALLQHFAGITCEELFGAPMQDEREHRLRKLIADMQTPTRQELCKELGVSPSRLMILLEKYGIDPPWLHENQVGGRRISFWLSEAEWSMFHSAMLKSGDIHNSDFARRCILNAIKGDD